MGINIKYSPVFTGDAYHRAIAIHLYVGSIKIIPLNITKGKTKSPITLRAEESKIVDFKFIENQAMLQLAVLYDNENINYVKVYNTLSTPGVETLW